MLSHKRHDASKQRARRDPQSVARPSEEKFPQLFCPDMTHGDIVTARAIKSTSKILHCKNILSVHPLPLGL